MKTYLFWLLLGSLFAHNHPASGPIWHTDESTAIEAAQEVNRPILLVFSGSDWCRPCMQMDQSIFQSEAFQTYADKHLVLLKADFPRRRKNQLDSASQAEAAELAQAFNPEGLFPTLVLMAPNGEQLIRTGFHESWPALQATLQPHLP